MAVLQSETIVVNTHGLCRHDDVCIADLQDPIGTPERKCVRDNEPGRLTQHGSFETCRYA